VPLVDDLPAVTTKVRSAARAIDREGTPRRRGEPQEGERQTWKPDARGRVDGPAHPRGSPSRSASRSRSRSRRSLGVAEADLGGSEDVLRTAIKLTGNCHAAYRKARPSVRRRFNQAVLEAVYVKDRKVARTEFSEVFAPLFSRPSSNKPLQVDPRGRYSNSWQDLVARLHGLIREVGLQACAVIAADPETPGGVPGPISAQSPGPILGPIITGPPIGLDFAPVYRLRGGPVSSRTGCPRRTSASAIAPTAPGFPQRRIAICCWISRYGLRLEDRAGRRSAP